MPKKRETKYFDKTLLTRKKDRQRERGEEMLAEASEGISQEMAAAPAFAGYKSVEAAIQEGYQVNIIPDDSGLIGTNIPDPTINFQAASNQFQIGDPTHNAGIIIGTDRPGVLPSGYGGKGAQNCNAIDIVAGRMAGARGGKGPETGAIVGPSFGADAARIYIAQRTDVDLNFGLAEGKSGMATGISAIGVKADVVRVIGRAGIKIVTGRSFSFRGFGPDGETLSVGDSIEPAPPIELIAGNSDETRQVAGGLFNSPETLNTLQGVAMGEHTRDAFREMADLLGEVSSAVLNFALIQTSFNTAVCTGVFPWAAAVGPAASSQIISQVTIPLYQTRVNTTMFNMNFTEVTGYKYIPSRNVFST